MGITSLLVMSLLIGCDSLPGAGEEEDEATEEVVQEEPEEVAEEAHGAPDPLKGKSLEEICGMDGLALTKFSYDDLHSDFAKTCCTDKGLGEDHERCAMDWPFNDVPDCSAYADLRHDIVALYGKPFDDKDIAERYEDKPWYEARDDYKGTWLSITAKKNLKKLAALEKAKDGCEDKKDEEDEGEGDE